MSIMKWYLDRAVITKFKKVTLCIYNIKVFKTLVNRVLLFLNQYNSNCYRNTYYCMTQDY